MLHKFTRRALLGALGAGASSIWLPGFGRIEAQAGAANEPNLLFLYADGGWVSKDLIMRPPWAPPEWSEFEYYAPNKNYPDDLEWEFELGDSRLTEDDFSKILRPLYRHRDVMTVIEGLSMWTPVLDALGDDHARAHIHVWSAEPAARAEDVKSFGSAPSVDQRINEFIRQSRPDHQSMDFHISNEIFHYWLYRSDSGGGASIVPLIIEPSEGYQRFFGGLSSGGGGGGEQDTSDPLTDNAGYSLELAMRQFDEITPRLSGTDKAKLEAHRELLEGIRRRMGTTISCDGIERPSIGGRGSENWRQKILAYAEMAAAGFACGVSRVATIGGFMAPNDTYGLDPSASVHQEYEHKTDPSQGYTLSGSQLDTWTEKTDLMTARNVAQMELLASVIDVLKAVPNLLDNTLVVYQSELAHGNHGFEFHPTVMFGAGAGIVTPGRYIKYPTNQPRPSAPYGFDTHINTFGGLPHSRLLVSILQGFGLDTQYLGAPELQGYTGPIDNTGPLPRLTV